MRSRGEGSGKEREREKGKVGRVPLIWDWKKITGGWVDPTPVKKIRGWVELYGAGRRNESASRFCQTFRLTCGL